MNKHILTFAALCLVCVGVTACPNLGPLPVKAVSDVAFEIEDPASIHDGERAVSPGSTMSLPLTTLEIQPELLDAGVNQCSVDDRAAHRTNPSSILLKSNNTVDGKEPCSVFRILHVSGSCWKNKTIDLEDVLIGRGFAYKVCYLDSARADPTLAGKLRIEVMLERDPSQPKGGATWSGSTYPIVRILDNGTGDEDLAVCISKMLKRIRFQYQAKKPPLSCRFEVVFRFWLSELEPPREWLDRE